MKPLAPNFLATPALAAARATVIVVCVSDTPDVEAVLLGPDGAVDGASAGSLIIDCSTIAPSGAWDLAARLAERGLALESIVDHAVPGRTAEARPPTPSELRSTRVLALDLASASAKVRVGPPVDDEADAAWPAWTGTIPITMVRGAPVPASSA